MAVPLTTTINATRAHIAAGVLEAHGIPAWVEHDLITGWYPVPALGGVNLMVNEEDVEAAREVLNTLPPEPEPEKEEATYPVQTEPGFSLAESIGTGLLHGLWVGPALMVAMRLLQLLASAVANAMDDFNRTLIDRRWAEGLPAFLLNAAILGAVCGIVAGIAAWLLASYRYRHRAGVIFVWLVVLTYTGVLQLLLLLLFHLPEMIYYFVNSFIGDQ